MTDRARQILQWIGYVFFFTVLFFYFLYLGFPYNAMKDLAIGKIEENTQFRVEVTSFSPDMFTGFELRDVRVFHSAAIGSQMIAKVDEANLRFGLLSLLGGSLDLSLDVDLYGGNIAGDINASQEIAIADLTFRDLDLGQYDFGPFLSRFGDFRFAGKLGGLAKLDYNAADLRSAKGTLEFDLNGLKLQATKLYGMDIPTSTFEPSKLKMELGSRALKIVDGKLTGDNMSVELGGRMTLRDDLAKSNFAYHLKFKPAGELADKLGPVLTMLKKKDKDGFYRVNLTGSPAAPRFR